jgi:hypothetical protein
VFREQVGALARPRVTRERLGDEAMPALAARRAAALEADLLHQRVGDAVARIAPVFRFGPQELRATRKHIADLVDVLQGLLQRRGHQARGELGAHDAGRFQHPLLGGRQPIELHVDELLHTGWSVGLHFVDGYGQEPLAVFGDQHPATGQLVEQRHHVKRRSPGDPRHQVGQGPREGVPGKTSVDETLHRRHGELGRTKLQRARAGYQGAQGVVERVVRPLDLRMA